ncbi:hypothetical protein BpHYR1_021367 [Brachionus plicatilis]|uniref:Uncharacterized protein n=1 Tax=Brachionus plicatilis TaxID=10195 RepID=A0A3M7Q8S4_BRAPC|nr:hypothetical protein BpHYR1_021367 [Brachionus plicatilis]
MDRPTVLDKAASCASQISSVSPGKGLRLWRSAACLISFSSLANWRIESIMASDSNDPHTSCALNSKKFYSLFFVQSVLLEKKCNFSPRLACGGDLLGGHLWYLLAHNT